MVLSSGQQGARREQEILSTFRFWGRKRKLCEEDGPQIPVAVMRALGGYEANAREKLRAVWYISEKLKELGVAEDEEPASPSWTALGTRFFTKNIRERQVQRFCNQRHTLEKIFKTLSWASQEGCIRDAVRRKASGITWAWE